MTIHIIKFPTIFQPWSTKFGFMIFTDAAGAASSVASRGCYWALMAFCVLLFFAG